ncbi:MAG: trypsin-like peptidase domain-containing protein [Thermodesulfobacteriota bacterium]|nr:trypsin-like peptidase domain-containing protein [Thermodesulfobacteriota bacterium]
MYRLKEFVTHYLTGLLSVLLVLNLVIIIFSAMGVGLVQLRQVSTFFSTLVDDPAHYLTRSDDTENQQTRRASATAVQTAGIITGSNIKLVSSNETLIGSDETFAVAVSKVRTAVVNISCERIVPVNNSLENLNFDDPAQDLAAFGGIGSGIIIDSRGYILTCYHIVARASNIIITPFGNETRRYAAQIVAKNESLNLAILKINPSYNLNLAALGDSSMMEVADEVMAIGNPFGLEQSVTHGIISDNKRNLLIQGIVIKDMIQTDAAINRGSSGGPLINRRGEVIGINMAIYSPSGVYVGISFALPANQAKLFIAGTLNNITQPYY